MNIFANDSTTTFGGPKLGPLTPITPQLPLGLFDHEMPSVLVCNFDHAVNKLYCRKGLSKKFYVSGVV